MISNAGAFHRFGLGPRPGDLARWPDVRAALAEELATPGVAVLTGDALVTAGAALDALAADRQARRAAQAAGTPPPPGARQLPAQQSIYRSEVAARLDRVAAADMGYVERLVAFWSNHFAIEGGSGQIELALVGVFEREAIRPFVLGSFRDLLGAATKHPAMLKYLDNAVSVGPDSPIGRQQHSGLNENHARELLELHTIGVAAHFTQDDVTSLARVLTGWSYAGNRDQRGPISSFIFREAAHEPGAQTVLGVVYPAGGIEQGEAVLDALAAHPSTAIHIAFKLARHFVADEPPDALVQALAATFTATAGDLAALARALIDSDLAWADLTKLKTPQEYLWSGIRALGLRPRPQEFIEASRSLGQQLWYPPSPEGFSDESATWLAPDALTTRLDIAETVAATATVRQPPADLVGLVLGSSASAETREAVAAAETREQGLALLLMSPEFQRR